MYLAQHPLFINFYTVRGQPSIMLQRNAITSGRAPDPAHRARYSPG